MCLELDYENIFKKYSQFYIIIICYIIISWHIKKPFSCHMFHEMYKE
jgi:hypothetical protein